MKFGCNRIIAQWIKAQYSGYAVKQSVPMQKKKKIPGMISDYVE